MEARSIAQGPDAAATPLRPGSVVHVPAIADLQRTVTVEGAIRIGKPVPENWEIAFIAITPRNLREDTQRVSDDVRAAYKRVVGTDAPLGL